MFKGQVNSHTGFLPGFSYIKPSVAVITLLAYRPTGPIKTRRLILISTPLGVRKSFLRFHFLVLVSLGLW